MTLFGMLIGIYMGQEISRRQNEPCDLVHRQSRLPFGKLCFSCQRDLFAIALESASEKS